MNYYEQLNKAYMNTYGCSMENYKMRQEENNKLFNIPSQIEEKKKELLKTEKEIGFYTRTNDSRLGKEREKVNKLNREISSLENEYQIRKIVMNSKVDKLQHDFDERAKQEKYIQEYEKHKRIEEMKPKPKNETITLNDILGGR